jgi:phosphoribosyl 1,2-cyclic phosphodiesterase
MKLTVLGSSSAGNCYVLQNESEALIIEAGVTLAKVKQALDFNISKVAGCLISHLHGDHSAKAKDFEQCFPVYANKSVIEAKGLTKTTEIVSEKAYMVGNFKVLPFTAAHDVPCLGFLIRHESIGNLMFLTDSFLCEYTFKNLNHILIECNYSDECLNESVKNGLHYSVRDRVLTSHMELQTTKNVLLNQNLSEVHNIVLLHLSSQNSNPEQFFEVIAKATGKPTCIARTGMTLELSKSVY